MGVTTGLLLLFLSVPIFPLIVVGGLSMLISMIWGLLWVLVWPTNIFNYSVPDKTLLYIAIALLPFGFIYSYYVERNKKAKQKSDSASESQDSRNKDLQTKEIIWISAVLVLSVFLMLLSIKNVASIYNPAWLPWLTMKVVVILTLSIGLFWLCVMLIADDKVQSIPIYVIKVFIAILFFLFTNYMYASRIHPKIPSDLGGGRPIAVQIWIDSERSSPNLISSLHESKMERENEAVWKLSNIFLIWDTDDFLLITDTDNHGLVLNKDVVIQIQK